jgi:hypothetical protein
MLQDPWFIYGSASVVKTKSVYKMVASKPECMKLGKEIKKYYVRNTWKDQMCIWQPV